MTSSMRRMHSGRMLSRSASVLSRSRKCVFVMPRLDGMRGRCEVMLMMSVMPQVCRISADSAAWRLQREG